MADEFLSQLEQDGKSRFAKETFEIDTTDFPSDTVRNEQWRIQPLPAAIRDKLISLIQNGEYYRGIATSLVHRAYRMESGRRFRPSDVDALMKNTAFLDWVAEEIRFRNDFDWLLDIQGAEEKKPSVTTAGSSSE